MFYHKLIITLCVCISALSAQNKIESFEADFVQTVKNSSNNNIKYEGHIYVKELSKILWQYKKPVEKNIFIVNNSVIIDEPELEQAIITKLDKEINLYKLMKQAKKIDENNYESTLYNVTYKLKFDGKKLQTISYIDELENKVLIIFKNFKENLTINDKTFKFIAPEYYDLIQK